MKKLVLFTAMLVLFATTFMFTSCQEDEPVLPVSPIVHTDNPPKTLWSKNQIYLQTSQGYIEEGDYDPEYQGYYSQYSQNMDGTVTAYNTGNWYVQKVRKYWGIGKDENGIQKIFVSQSFETASVFGNSLLIIEDRVKRTGSAIVSFGISQNNPIGTDYMIYGIY